ncbi:hypothetical protein DKT69_34795 [Micromonospora sicca]|uniref:Uncharacterized protein n=1 Tax=Micromonospora sicca TaxID=2202420 RepID=A0A317CXW3_9ACTN|nr:hypothetical protein DKT69_34795 [Micromonospora sp. 4G51]
MQQRGAQPGTARPSQRVQKALVNMEGGEQVAGRVTRHRQQAQFLDILDAFDKCTGPRRRAACEPPLDPIGPRSGHRPVHQPDKGRLGKQGLIQRIEVDRFPARGRRTDHPADVGAPEPDEVDLDAVLPPPQTV